MPRSYFGVKSFDVEVIREPEHGAGARALLSGIGEKKVWLSSHDPGIAG
jgi:hypothetical protein